MLPVVAATAHRRGYLRAREVRRCLLGLDAITAVDDLDGRLRSLTRLQPRDLTHVDDPRIDALVWRNEDGGPLVVAHPVAPTSERFRLARAIHFWLYAGADTHPRLLTPSFTSSQRESRAFAAELLAPSEGLRARGLEGPVREADVNQVAKEYSVSPLVVAHQIENHRIGRVAYF
jgi:hypothetical protein